MIVVDSLSQPVTSKSSSSVFKLCFLDFLTGHPARKYVIDFLRMIVVDSLSEPVTSKSNNSVFKLCL